MTEYHKIQTVYLRDPETKFKTLLEGQWTLPEFNYLKSLKWEWTEKVDGTNIRVTWNGGEPRFTGKTDDAQMPLHLLKSLAETFTRDKFLAALPNIENDPCYSVCLYGEGYGAKIQRVGSRYIPDGCGFILFDVKVGDWWLDRKDVYDIADKFGIKRVPVIDTGTLTAAVAHVQAGFKSIISVDATLDAEGLVMRPLMQLWNRKGERIIAKVKMKDFTHAP